ncbi:MAG: 30S ribosomal protein S7 [bacterium]|nr:30S ribosomal protein S7 [bacterium]
MRKKRNYTREHRPDYVFNNVIIGRFINYLMEDGKKAVAERVMYDALEAVKKQSGQNPTEVFDKAITNVSPMVEVASKRVGGANYQIPREVRPARRFVLACRWLIAAARSKKGKNMSDRLAEEILLASKNEGNAIKKKLDTHRMAEANRAFAHFAR